MCTFSLKMNSWLFRYYAEEPPGSWQKLVLPNYIYQTVRLNIKNKQEMKINHAVVSEYN